MNLPQAHGHQTTHALFFTAPLKGWRGVVGLRVGCVGKKHGFTFGKKRYGVGYLT
jgi:hypothetical protein